MVDPMFKPEEGKLEDPKFVSVHYFWFMYPDMWLIFGQPEQHRPRPSPGAVYRLIEKSAVRLSEFLEECSIRLELLGGQNYLLMVGTRMTGAISAMVWESTKAWSRGDVLTDQGSDYVKKHRHRFGLDAVPDRHLDRCLDEAEEYCYELLTALSTSINDFANYFQLNAKEVACLRFHVTQLIGFMVRDRNPMTGEPLADGTEGHLPGDRAGLRAEAKQETKEYGEENVAVEQVPDTEVFEVNISRNTVRRGLHEGIEVAVSRNTVRQGLQEVLSDC